MKYFSTFSGIGGFELGIKQAYDNHIRHKTNDTRESAENVQGHLSNSKRNDVERALQCVGYSELDKYAVQIYQKHFPEHKNYGDITKINADTLPDFDLLVGGFPCQAFSIAGKRKGFDDTRGTLFFDLARILKAKKPRYFIFENVKGLLSHDNGNTFKTIISTIDELGYDCQWQVLNSKNHGVPQNRERVFIIGHLRGTGRPKVFPFGGTNEKDTRIIGQDVAYTIDANYHKGTNTLEKSRRSLVQLNNPTHSNNRIYGLNGISPTLNTMQGGNRQPFVALTERRTEEAKELRKKGIVKDTRNLKKLTPREDGLANTITSVADDKNRYLIGEMKIRRLTPTECERLQGFPDGWTDGVSDTQRYKTLGNAVTVNVIEEIVKKLFRTE